MNKKEINFVSIGLLGGFVFSATLVFLKSTEILEISIWACLAPLFAVLGYLAVVTVCLLAFFFSTVKRQSGLKEDLETLEKIYSQIGEKKNG